jgi:Tol biopolymer transport system component
MGRAGVIAAALALASALVPAIAGASANGRLAYSASAGGASSQVFSVSPGGGDPLQITHEADGAAHPDWSPDGRFVAFDVGGTRLAVAAADGTGERFVTTEVNATDPSWSPDASRLAFTGVDYDVNGNPEDTSLYVTQADGSNYVRIGPGSEPDWSPRGDWIVYRSNPARSGGCAGIWRMRSDGSDDGPLAPGTPNGASCLGGGSDPSFSPDGRRVAFVSAGGSAIYTASLHGGRKRRVVRDARPKTSPVFSPDGREIVYSTSGPGAGLWMVAAGGGRPRRIASGGGQLAWQPLPG